MREEGGSGKDWARYSKCVFECLLGMFSFLLARLSESMWILWVHARRIDGHRVLALLVVGSGRTAGRTVPPKQYKMLPWLIDWLMLCALWKLYTFIACTYTPWIMVQIKSISYLWQIAYLYSIRIYLIMAPEFPFAFQAGQTECMGSGGILNIRWHLRHNLMAHERWVCK